MKRVLLLNASEEVLSVVQWQRAVILYLQGKARKPHGYDDYYDIQTASGVFQLPTALVLVTYVRIPYKEVSVTKANVYRRDGGECAYCGKRLTNATATIDHVIPTSRGGKHVWRNVVLSCKKCNNKKDNKLLSEVNMKLRWKPYVPKFDLLIMTAYDMRTKKEWTRWLLT